MNFVGAVLVFAQLVRAYEDRYLYPELRSDLQKYQDSSRCYPNDGDWHLMYRNYNYDPNMGGAAKCVTYSTIGRYENFTTPATFAYGNFQTVKGRLILDSSTCYVARNFGTFVPDDPSLPSEVLYVIYADCSLCVVLRHRYAAEGRGCSLWRRADTMNLSGDACEFIYDLNCGTSPKYKIFDDECLS